MKKFPRTLQKLLAPDGENSHFGKQVWKAANFAVGLQANSAFNLPAFFAAEEHEIIDCQEVEIGRIVPVMREQTCLGRAAA